MGFEEACRDTVLPLGWLMCTRNTNLTRVFLRPMSVSPLRSSMSELRSFRIPAQSILGQRQERVKFNTIFQIRHIFKIMEKCFVLFHSVAVCYYKATVSKSINSCFLCYTTYTHTGYSLQNLFYRRYCYGQRLKWEQI